ncbi:GNAT family N-acetyltransferase [Streptomyces sp. NPDC048718]|uniref:GNAT family N-acetyltransferase n=1 Tax=Streptomyces sp. NPDC048718 TaxID=3365587 RepID=UPI00371DC4AF
MNDSTDTTEASDSTGSTDGAGSAEAAATAADLKAPADGVPPLVTARLLLHPLTATEAGRVVESAPAPGDRWAEGYPAPGDVRGARGFLNGVAERGDPGVWRAYEIRQPADGLAIGGIGFHGPPDADGVVTIGYGLVPAVRGRGYASESLRALIARARAAGATAVRGDADLDNLASQRVMEAAGMTYEGEDEQVRNYRVVFAERGAAEDPSGL